MQKMKKSRLRLIVSGVITVWALTADLFAQSGTEHSVWDRLLKATVNEAGWVDYEEIQQSWGNSLKTYITFLGITDIHNLPTDDARKAFWINAYNALTIQILLDEGLPEEVPHAAFFGNNIFKQQTYLVAGKVRSLDEIEHQILRKQYHDARIHAALVCGASSCPRLRPEAYTADRLDAQLDEESRIWIQTGRNKQGRRKNVLNRADKVYRLSKIFKWFQEDFMGGRRGDVLDFLLKYADNDTVDFVRKNHVTIRYLDYDWSLNSQDHEPSRE